MLQIVYFWQHLKYCFARSAAFDGQLLLLLLNPIELSGELLKLKNMKTVAQARIKGIKDVVRVCLRC